MQLTHTRSLLEVVGAADTPRIVAPPHGGSGGFRLPGPTPERVKSRTGRRCFVTGPTPPVASSKAAAAA